MILYIVGKLAPGSSHLTRGLVKYVLGRGYFRAFPSQNGDKYVTSSPPQWLNLSFGHRLCLRTFCHTEELLYHYYFYSFNLFISRTAPSESTTCGKFVLQQRRVQQCWISQHTDCCLLQYVVCALPNVRHASRCSRLVYWVTTTAVTFVV